MKTPLKRNIFLRCLQKFFKFFDLYGQNVNLYVNKRPKFYSSFSGMVSILIIFLIVYTFAGIIISWLQKQRFTVITSSVNFSVTQLLTNNQTYEYPLNYQNYLVYFMIQSLTPTQSLINEQLNNYVTFGFSYIDTNLQRSILDYEFCQTQKYDIFLGMDEGTIKADAGKINTNRICLKNPAIIGLFPDSKTKIIHQPEIHFSIYQCQNSSGNNNSCAPKNEIDNIISTITVQASIPTTLYDFQNAAKPQKNLHDFKFISLDNAMLKSYKNYIVPTNLYTDNGFIEENYVLEQTNFNPNLFYDPNIRSASDPLFDFSFIVGLNVQMYYQKNQKLNEIIGSLGGIINAIFLLGKLICMSYNSLYLKFKIIKGAFFNANIIEAEVSISPKNKENIAQKTEKNSFSCLRYLFPSKNVSNFYEKGARNLHEYLDIRKIIKRMQDLDKLKMVLLSRNQRRLFEYIPKPDVLNNSRAKLSMEALKSKVNRRALPNKLKTLLINNDENDPINKRILEFLDPKLKNVIEANSLMG